MRKSILKLLRARNQDDLLLAIELMSAEGYTRKQVISTMNVVWRLEYGRYKGIDTLYFDTNGTVKYMFYPNGFTKYNPPSEDMFNRWFPKYQEIIYEEKHTEVTP